jgi:hypothetical protein
MSMLCSLSDVKTMLKISAQDTTQDDFLNLLIKQISGAIEGYIGYKLARAEYTDELHSTDNRQLIQLNHFPLQSVSACSINDVAVADYKLFPEYQRWGRLYRGIGWSGGAYTRGFTHDVVAGVWEIKTTYIAGYYLPGDTGYVEGADNSLPYDIVTCCLNSVVEKYNLDKMGAVGLKAHTEGHISDTFSDSANDTGLSESAKKMLSKYVWYGVA